MVSKPVVCSRPGAAVARASLIQVTDHRVVKTDTGVVKVLLWRARRWRSDPVFGIHLRAALADIDRSQL